MRVSVGLYFVKYINGQVSAIMTTNTLLLKWKLILTPDFGFLSRFNKYFLERLGDGSSVETN